MCPKGHSLLLGSDSVVGRWRWAAHARRCAACAEVHTAERFVEAFAARAGRWPAVGEAVGVRGRRRAWKLAAAAAVIALILPLALSVQWGRGRHVATSPPAVTSADQVRVVHWVGAQTIHDKVLPMEMTIAYPDQERATLNGDTTITDRHTGYELNIRAKPISYSWHPTPFRYIRSRAPDGITQTGNGYTLAGRRRGLESGGAKLLRHAESKLPNGDERHELEYQLTEAQWAPYTITLEVDPRTDLILAWDETNHDTDESGQRYSWRVTVDRVEYNIDLPPDYFSTQPPSGEEVMDYSTPEGIKAIYQGAIAEVEKLSSDPEKQRALVAQINGARLFGSERLSELAPADRQVILAKLATYGIERDGRPIVAAARGDGPQGAAEEAQAHLDRRAELEQALRDLESQSAELARMLQERPELASPQTKEQLEQTRRAQALMQAQQSQAQAHAAELAAEEAALKARVQQIEAELRAHTASLQRAQKDLAAAQAAVAKQGDEEARAQQKQLEALAARLRAEAESLRAYEAEAQQQLHQARQRLAYAEAKLAANRAQIEAAQRAIEAARAPKRKAAGKPAKRK